MNILKRSTLSLLIVFSQNAHCIVDYSEAVPENKPSSKANSATQIQTSRNESKSLIWKSDFSLNSNYEAVQIETEKIGVLNLNTHLQTPFNFYLDATYWNAQTKLGSQSGNPKIILGFNWLRFGSPSDEARLDIFGGVKLSGSSQLASTRTDKIFGIETTKRFGSFGLGIGYDITLSGPPKRVQDMSIGNINRIALSGGWMVSNDIQFELEIENFKINQSSDASAQNHLVNGISFSTLSPKMILTIAPAVGLELGARFRTNKPKSDQNLASAKLFDLHGAYTNSLFAGLNLSL